jgi:hypothetical protein
MTSTSFTRKIFFSLLLTLSLAGYAISQTYWAENRPPAGTAHSLPTRLFPTDNWWNLQVSQAPLAASSASYISGLAGVVPSYDWGHVYGLPYTTVSGNYPKVNFQGGTYWDESDHIGYPIPIPALTQPGWTEDITGTINNPVSTGDRHLLIVDVDNQFLYEIYNPFHNAGSSAVQWNGVTVQPGAYYCASAAFWDMKTNNTRPDGWTSSDAAGLQVLPGLVQYDEIMGTGPITHAHRFTLNFSANTAPLYVWPATHYAGAYSATHPPLGTRFRLKASKDISFAGPHAQKLLQSMKDYGLIFADNGPNGQITGTNDARWGNYESPIRVEIATALGGLTFNDFEVVQLGWQPNPTPTPGGSMTLADSGTGLNRKVTVESTGLFRVVFEAGDNWGLAQWYDLVNDPSAQTNLTGPGYGVTNDISTAEPGLFQQVFYGTTPDDPKLYTRAAAYYFPNSPRSFNILENSASRVVVQAISSPVVNAVGVLSNVTVEVTYYIYPNGKIYVHSVLRVAAAQTAGEWRNATLGLSDPTSVDPYSGSDSTGWIRSSTTQNPYDSLGAAESYIFAYWRASTTPAPYTNFTRASVLLIPKPGNPNQGRQGKHNWSGWKRWYYGNVSLNLAAGQSLTQDYLIQLGTQGSAVLPNINSSAVAGSIAQAYFANPTPPNPSPTPTPTPTPTPAASIKVNFQPAGAAVPTGYLADTGLVYGDRGNGYSYGWDQSTLAVDRNSAGSPDQRYDTLNVWWANSWEITVPNGTYTVHVVAGDADYYDSIFRINVEGVLTVNGTPTSTMHWLEGTQTITVNDGKLTVSQGAGSYNNKICFIDISPAGQSFTNFALASNGGVASASTTSEGNYPASAINNGDRKGLNYGNGGGWRDGAESGSPDWVQIDFNGAKSISEIDVVTIQDGYENPVEPTETMTFSGYGITDYAVQYWNGSAWTTVSGGSVTGNNKVWRKFTFAAVTTTKVRVFITDALYGRSRVMEVEAWGGGAPTATNVARASNGGVASASTTSEGNYPASAVINGLRKGNIWGDGGGWRDSTDSFPDWVQVDFNGSKTISEIDVFTIQDDYDNPVEPTETLTFSVHGIVDYEVQYWNGSVWTTVPGGSVSGNNKVWRKFNFAAVTTTKIRVLVNYALNGRSRVVEVEAY